MDVTDLAGLRAIEERTTGKKLKVPPRPVHHAVSAKVSQHFLPHGPGVTAPKIVKRKRPKPRAPEDRLKAFIDHVNRIAGR